MQLKPFLIDNFHYFDKKQLGEQVSHVSIVDWKNLLQEKKSLYPHHYFIVIEGARVLFADSLLLTVIHVKQENKMMVIELDTDLKQDEINLVIIQIHHQEQGLILRTLGEHATSIVHENIVAQKSHSYMRLDVDNRCYYHHLVHSLSQQVSHFEMEMKIKGSCHAYWLQSQQESRVKVDLQATLFEQAQLRHRSLNCLQHAQLRDDTIEIIHEQHGAKSFIEHLNLNHGKAVSQVNSVIKANAFDNETQQNIKHLLLSSEALSYSKPNLMIENPSVVAAHGNSIGSLDREHIFYLTQRGLSEQQARTLITHSMIQNFCYQTYYSLPFLQYFLGAHHA